MDNDSLKTASVFLMVSALALFVGGVFVLQTFQPGGNVWGYLFWFSLSQVAAAVSFVAGLLLLAYSGWRK